MDDEVNSLVITFDELLRRSSFAPMLSSMLQMLEEHYQSAVDVEFTVNIPDPFSQPLQAQISLLQCRPQSYLKTSTPIHIPAGLKIDDLVFTTTFMVPRGYLSNIRHVIYIDPEAYYALDSDRSRKELRGLISQVNQKLPPKTFICVGPGRWGSVNTDLGVYVSYADICNTGALVEVSGTGMGMAPEPSLGTHFFQDLMEAQIYPLAINLDIANTVFNRNFFHDSPNRLNVVLQYDSHSQNIIKLIAVDDIRHGNHLEITMDDEAGLAAAFIKLD